MSHRSAQEVLEAHRAQWLGLPGVEGAGIGAEEGRTVIYIYTSQPAAQVERELPDQQDGYPLIVRRTGEIKPLD